MKTTKTWQSQAQSSNKIFVRFIRINRTHWSWIAVLMAMMILTALIDSVYPYLSKKILDEGIRLGNKALTIQLFVIYVGLTLLQAIGFHGLYKYFVDVLAERLQYTLRDKLFNHVQRLPFSFFDRTSIGSIMTYIVSDTEKASELITQGLLVIVWDAMYIVASAYFMMLINWRLAVVILIVFPIVSVLVTKFRQKIVEEYRKVRSAIDAVTSGLNEHISGIRTVKSFCRENENLYSFTELCNILYRRSYRAAWLSGLFTPIVQLVSATALSIIAWYGGWLTALGKIGLTVGAFQAFTWYLSSISEPIRDLANTFAEMQHGIAAAERIFAIIDENPEEVGKSESNNHSEIRGDISFENVSFFYDLDKPILRDFNLNIRVAEKIALVGPTGGGKSTIINLICRFYEPTRGVIRLGHYDYTTMDLSLIRSQIGVVLQTTNLFPGTVYDNIRYGKLNASAREVEEAIRLVHADSFLDMLDKEVGEDGNLLSVGQKQLISLFRVVLKQPKIFIMDEATSSVDSVTEAIIRQGMNVLMQDRTSIIIAHRLATITCVDRIVFIDEGRIIEMGSHEELMKAQGHYYQLYTQQFRRQLEQEYYLEAKERESKYQFLS